jgi:hypothetical protein
MINFVAKLVLYIFEDLTLLISQFNRVTPK